VVDVISPEPSLCGVWAALADADLPGVEARPAHCYFDDRGGVHGWAAMRVRAHEADGARQRAQAVVDGILSRAPPEVTGHRGLRVVVRVAPASGPSWETSKWLLAPRATERMARPVPWSHYEPAGDGLSLTIVWTSGRRQLDRVDVTENPDRVRITVHERHPPLLGAGGALAVSRCARRSTQQTVRLARPLGHRELRDGFDGGLRTRANVDD
jgi:hypothetical protein